MILSLCFSLALFSWTRFGSHGVLEACRGDRALIQLILAGHRQVDCKKLNCWTTYRWIAVFRKCAQNTWYHCHWRNWFATVIIKWPLTRIRFSTWRKNNNLLFITVCGSNIHFFHNFLIGTIQKGGFFQNSIFWTSLQALSMSNFSFFFQNHLSLSLQAMA